MYATPRFVYLHLPKAGGTFVTSVLQRVAPQDAAFFAKRVLRKLGVPVTVELPVHGTYRDVPVPLRNRMMLSVLRNPLDQYASEFRFDRHHDHPEQFFGESDLLKTCWPSYPDLTFDQYVRCMNQTRTVLRCPGLPEELQPGVYSQIFIQFFATNPEKLLRDLSPQLVRSGRIWDYLPSIQFLFTHDLNRGLYDFLLQQGYPENKLAFIPELERIHPEGKGRTSDDDWQSYYTPDLYHYVCKREWLLLSLFQELRHEAEKWDGSALPHVRAA